jgi:hypothetical protein
MRPGARVRWWLTALAVIVAVAASVLTVGGSGSPRAARPATTPAITRSKTAATRLQRSVLVADVEKLARARSATGASLKDLTDSPGMPTCAAPPLPAATDPPGASYGIPFLAAITDGQILAGYDEWTANNNYYTYPKKGPDKVTYHLYPWQSKIFNVTGWVTGLLELPSLNAEIPPQDIVFCDQGGVNCVSGNPPPAGECIDLISQYAPSNASKVPPPPVTNYPPPGQACWSPTSGCLPIALTLTPTLLPPTAGNPSGDTSLTVTGVEPDGALDLQVTTAAVTTATETPPESSTSLVCSDAATVLSVSTTAPAKLPPTAPPTPNPVTKGHPSTDNTDDRSLQTPPEPLTGPLASASSTLAGNDFAIPAFVPSTSSGGPCYDAGAVPELLNTYAGGWGVTFADQTTGLYYRKGGGGPIVAQPGWAQFSATTTVVKLGLPVGPPANFHL